MDLSKRLEVTEKAVARSPVQVSASDPQELIRLTEALDELASKIDRIGGVVVKLYQLTENLDLAIKKAEPLPQQPQFDEAVVEWIRDKVEKKRKKQLKKWRKKQGRKRKD